MKGFTLLEILVAVSIFTLLSLAIFAVMDLGRDSWFTGSAVTETHQEITKSFMIMEKEIRETRAAEIDLTSGTSAPSITLKVPQDIDADGDVLDALGRIEWSGNITYALNASNQITRTASGATSVIANNIVSLQFTRPVASPDIVQVDVAARKTSFTGRQFQETGQIVIKMRNL
jgi:prepilin-type N-terminal cleavage/methylation domain-containing protein